MRVCIVGSADGKLPRRGTGVQTSSKALPARPLCISSIFPPTILLSRTACQASSVLAQLAFSPARPAVLPVHLHLYHTCGWGGPGSSSPATAGVLSRAVGCSLGSAHVSEMSHCSTQRLFHEGSVSATGFSGSGYKGTRARPAPGQSALSPGESREAGGGDLEAREARLPGARGRESLRCRFFWCALAWPAHLTVQGSPRAFEKVPRYFVSLVAVALVQLN